MEAPPATVTRLGLLTSILIALAFSARALPHRLPARAIRGVVVDASGRPVGGVLVDVFLDYHGPVVCDVRAVFHPQNTAITDSLGRFEIPIAGTLEFWPQPVGFLLRSRGGFREIHSAVRRVVMPSALSYGVPDDDSGVARATVRGRTLVDGRPVRASVITEAPQYVGESYVDREMAFAAADGRFELGARHWGHVEVIAVWTDEHHRPYRARAALDLALGETRADLTLNLQPVRDFHTTPYQRPFTLP